jgi:hypothetical protein
MGNAGTTNDKTRRLFDGYRHTVPENRYPKLATPGISGPDPLLDFRKTQILPLDQLPPTEG